jgi:hypothetical protein
LHRKTGRLGDLKNAIDGGSDSPKLIDDVRAIPNKPPWATQ